MIALVRAEMLKLRSTRTPVWLLLATLAMVALTVAVSVPEAGAKNPTLPLDDPSLLSVTVGGSFGVPLVMVVLLGGVAFTQEFRYGTVTSTYLVQPRRTSILVAKGVALTLVSLMITTLTLAVSVPFTIALIASRDGKVSLGAQFWQMAAAGYAVMGVLAVIGVAIGALLRNQITAVIAVLVWMLLVEHLVLGAYPTVGRWMPQAATYSLMQLGPATEADGRLLSVSASGLALAAYAAGAIILALRLTPKRDVL